MPPITRLTIHPQVPQHIDEETNKAQDTLTGNLAVIHDYILQYLNASNYLDVHTQLFLTEVLHALGTNIQRSEELLKRMDNIAEQLSLSRTSPDKEESEKE